MSGKWQRRVVVYRHSETEADPPGKNTHKPKRQERKKRSKEQKIKQKTAVITRKKTKTEKERERGRGESCRRQKWKQERKWLSYDFERSLRFFKIARLLLAIFLFIYFFEMHR
jgi:hypothetical protein